MPDPIEAITQMDWEGQAEEWLGMVVKRGRAGWDKLDGRRQYLVVQTLQDIARLRLNELGGLDVSEELPYAEASLTNLGVVASIEVAQTVMNILQDSLKMAGSILSGILGKVKL